MKSIRTRVFVFPRSSPQRPPEALPSPLLQCLFRLGSTALRRAAGRSGEQPRCASGKSRGQGWGKRGQRPREARGKSRTEWPCFGATHP